MAMYRMNRFSKLTGLTPHVIRAWERRHHLVKPERGANRYRLYTDEDVVLFRYLKGEIEKGHSIGELAEVGREELLARAQLASVEPAHVDPLSERLLAELVEAIQENDRVTFERKLNGAVAVIPFEEAHQRFLVPLQERIGELWHDGSIGTAQEHYATHQVQQKVYSAMNQLRVVDHGPKVVVACPQDELHEIGAQLVAYLCTARGCRTHYLGANLPMDDLAHYCKQVCPSLTLLSLTILLSESEVETLARDLFHKVSTVSVVGVGGRGALPFSVIFERENIRVFQSLKQLEAYLFTVSS